jgi:aquaporin Z
MGIALGSTAITIVMSPWGKQSGGHLNPAITLSFYRLGKVRTWDAVFYGAAQFVGAVAGVALAAAVLRSALAHDSVRYVITKPGTYGNSVAFAAELVISFVLMLTVLAVSSRESLARYTPYFAGVLVATWICFEAPLSGMSMNPARTFGSAFCARYWQALWIYFTAPPLGMLAAAELFLRFAAGVPRNARSCTTPTTSAAYSAADICPPTTRQNEPRSIEMKKMRIALPVFVVALVAGWYAFRPERLVVNQRVNEALPTVQAAAPERTLASGTFHTVLHDTSGRATVYRLGDGSRVLRFTNFKTSNGPDVHVYLVAADDAKDSDSVKQAGFIDLGTIKGNIGDQNYTLASDVDLSRYRAVSVWCKRFSANFGTAPLTADRMMSQK